MPDQASDLARRLACNAEAVCRHYLSSGKRAGNYWLVGDARNTPGKSLFVRLSGPDSGKGAAGKWTDGATGEHGDLLDIIRESCRLENFRAAAEEARRFLRLPRRVPRHADLLPSLEPASVPKLSTNSPAQAGFAEAGMRLFAASRPIAGTLAESYLRGRGITSLQHVESLRFHANCRYRADATTEADDDADAAIRTEVWPALIGAVTDNCGDLTGVQRTWLDPSGAGKAPVETPRRALGHLVGCGVRFGAVDDVLAVGEGIETMLSLRCVLPALPVVAALSSSHLGAFLFPANLRRLYVARDNDAAGDSAFSILTARAQALDIEVLALLPRLQDFNDDLRHLPRADLRAALRSQLAPEDVPRFMSSEDAGHGR